MLFRSLRFLSSTLWPLKKLVTVRHKISQTFFNNILNIPNITVHAGNNQTIIFCLSPRRNLQGCQIVLCIAYQIG
jgi:hypothetical protein